MRRFYSPKLTPEFIQKSASIELAGAEFRHLNSALRLKAGTEVELFNGRGTVCRGTIAFVEKEFAVIEITGSIEPAPGTVGVNESPVEILLVQGLAKGTKPEFIIQKATELGVKEVRLYIAGRSVPDLSGTKAGKRAEAKLVRWSRVAMEAAKQCGRSVVPKVLLFDSLSDAIGTVGTGFFFTLEQKPGALSGSSTREVLCGVTERNTVLAVIGPEGGMDGREQEVALESGLIPLSLGPRILRTETAAVTALSILQYELGDLS